MKKLLTITSIMTLALSSAVYAAEFNHGNHNDNSHLFATNNTMTVNCGSMSLSSCLYGPNLDQVTESKCDTLISPNADIYAIPWGSSYYHTVQSYGTTPLSAIFTGGQYEVTVKYSCQALYHPAKKLIMK